MYGLTKEEIKLCWDISRERDQQEAAEERAEAEYWDQRQDQDRDDREEA
jgi:hypothetical protein